MIKQLISLSIIALSAHAHADEYQYKVTPNAQQVADLQDEDNDGVINARDLCFDTPSFAEVDNDGCGTIVSSWEESGLHILFNNDSSEVQSFFIGQIKQMADFLDRYPETAIEIQGYASAVGSDQYNLELSKRRAETVEQLLESYGVASSRVTIVGYGETNLTELGDDEISHAKNRKVVAKVVGHKGNVKEEWTIFTKHPK